MARQNLLLGSAALTLALAAGIANADELLYYNNFQGGELGSEWSENSVRNRADTFSWFNGRYTNQQTVLTLEAVQLGGDGGQDGGDGDGDGDGDNGGGQKRVLYTLEFDFYAIDSWDGDDRNYGPDTFQVRLDGAPIFAETFSNNHGKQSFREPDVGRDHLGFSEVWKDSIYRNITVEFELSEPAETFSLGFKGVGLQSMIDESWAIDNVEVRYDVIPAPATLGSMAGLLLLGGRRRGA